LSKLVRKPEAKLHAWT